MPLSNLEYIPLRLIRRFVLSDRLLLRFGKLFPYYRTNHNQVDPSPLVDAYDSRLKSAGFEPRGTRILEIGVGRTNSTCYEIAARFDPSTTYALEPFVDFGATDDDRLLELVSKRNHQAKEAIANRVKRVRDLTSIPSGSVDLVLSSSVLEHVSDPDSLFKELHRVLSANGSMLHLVDYRDHFFKYPYHFLQFNKTTWNRWLNPGDLPVWKVYDHIEQISAAGFKVRVLDETRDDRAFGLVAERISKDYRRDDSRLLTMVASLFATKT